MVKLSPSDGYADVVIGLQHGDEGKGRFIDDLAVDYNWVARYNGGPNAGHTIEANGHKLALHQIPSGVNYPHKKLYIAAQCVVNIRKLADEIAEVESKGIQVSQRLRISSQASVIQPAHVLEDKLTMSSIGTTVNGVGVAYGKQAYRAQHGERVDIRMGDLVTKADWAFAQMKKMLDLEIQRYDTTDPDVQQAIANARAEMESLPVYLEKIKTCIDGNPLLLLNEIRMGMRVLLEGAQSFGLDRTFGVTPDVTSSNTGVAAAFLSTGIPVDYKRKAYGVVKLLPSRVGYGPFVTEFGGERSEQYCMEQGGNKHRQEVERQLYEHRINELFRSEDPLDVSIAVRMDGGEYGASTGRPRRPGIFDETFVRQGIQMNGLDGIFLTKGDKLNVFSRMRHPSIRVATGYMLGDQKIDYVPTTKEDLQKVVPIIQEYESFADDISGIRDAQQFPPQLRRFLLESRDRLGCEFEALGVSPHRDGKVTLNGSLK